MATEADLTFCYSTLKSWVDLLIELSERLKQNDYEMFAFFFNRFPVTFEEEIHRLREVFEQTKTYRLAVPTTSPPDFCGHKAACWSDAVAFVTLAQLPDEVSSSIPELQDDVSRRLLEERSDRDVERLADIDLLFRLSRHLWPPWERWNRGVNEPTYVELTERSVLSVRDRKCPTLVMIRSQYADAEAALEREHAHVLIEMRRDGIIRSDSPAVSEPLALANPLTPTSTIGSTTVDNGPKPDPRDPNDLALWSKARLPKNWLKIIKSLTGEEMSSDTFARRRKDGTFVPHPNREGHKVRLLLSTLPRGYDDSQ